ncbi:nonstructural protein 1 [Galliform chaphamaparvovirus 15]|nr:nonstructural protein 1 [Galliform chaphamaparvovirus 15]
MHTHPRFMNEYGTCTIDCLKGQKAHKPVALMEYMMKNPIWVISNTERLLQLSHDIEQHDLCARFRSSNEGKVDIDRANPMIQDILQTICEFSCKTVEDVIRCDPEMVVKYLHRPGFNTVVQNCLTFAKCTGATWSLKNFQSYSPNPAAIHAILLTQGIRPSDWDLIFYKWITKSEPKKNTICIEGPSNTGKSSIISGLRKVCPGGEIVNGQNFNFEGLIECYWGKWEEPLLADEQAEKFKQIAEGMDCAIPVKFKRPVVLPRTPIFITTNFPLWKWCPNQEPMLRNRIWFFEFVHDMSSGRFYPRITEPSCKCCYCQLSRGRTASSSEPTTSRVQAKSGSSSSDEQLDAGPSLTESFVGSGSMPEGAGCSRSTTTTSSSRGESSSDSAIGGSTSTTTSRSNRSSTESGSSSSGERICSTISTHTESMVTHTTRGRSRHDSRSLSRKRLRSTRSGHARRNTRNDENLPPMVSMGRPRRKKPQMANEISTSSTRLDREMGTIIVPQKEEWARYLSYLYLTFVAPAKPDIDLTCHESISDLSSSEDE